MMPDDQANSDLSVYTMQQPFDDTTKAYYRRYFENLQISAIAQYEVFARSRAIDLLVTCPATDRQKLTDTVFAHFRAVNALEFKGYHDPLTAVNFNVIMMRAWGIGAIEKEKAEKEQAEQAVESTDPFKAFPPSAIAEMPDQRTVTIVCVTRPTKILDDLRANFCFAPTAEPGIYCNHEHQLPVWIIHPTELALKPANYPLLPLARGAKLAQFIELCIQQGLVDYLRLTLDIGLLNDPSVVWRKIMEAVQMKVEIREDTWPYIDEFFRSVPEALQKVSTVQEALDEREQRGIRQSILRVLRHKFGALPANVIQMIEAIHNVEQLEQRLERALDSTSLSDFNSRQT